MTNGERMEKEGDDLAWAKLAVDEALAAVARGEVISREEYKARNAARLASLCRRNVGVCPSQSD